MAFLDQAGNHPAFAGAEIEFAMRFEDFADRPIGGAFDFLVDIDEVGVEQRRKAASDRGLADPHQADQHHGALRVAQERDRVPHRRGSRARRVVP